MVTKQWLSATTVPSTSYVCGYCGERVASAHGYQGHPPAQPGRPAQSGDIEFIRICPHCSCPTHFAANGRQTPGGLPSRGVAHVPADIEALYTEALRACSVGAPTAAVLACRKILMHVAVEKGAPAGDSFKSYVEHLDKHGYIPPDGKGWVDYIRNRGNEANHDILVMTAADAEGLMTLTEMLLRLIYEFPKRVPQLPPKKPGTP